MYISTPVEMKGLSLMTLKEFLTKLGAMPSDADLVFAAEGKEIAGGYHLTEFKLARIASIDCAARTSAWTEASMQLLDGSGGEYMKLGKFTEIASKSAEFVPDLDQVTLGVEFSPENAGIRIYDLGEPTFENGRVNVPLTPRTASCKPKADFAAAVAATGIPQPAQSSCCGPARTSCC